MFWSDVGTDVIYRASIDGTGVLYSVVDSYISAVGKTFESNSHSVIGNFVAFQQMT